MQILLLLNRRVKSDPRLPAASCRWQSRDSICIPHKHVFLPKFQTGLVTQYPHCLQTLKTAPTDLKDRVVAEFAIIQGFDRSRR